MTLNKPSEVGYDIRGKDGKISLRKFENTLDWSLDTIKLEEAYEKETRRKNMSFTVEGKQYSQIVINVKFSYSFKLFNKCGKDCFVRAGYALRDCTMFDGICVKDGQLVAIQTNVPVHDALPDSLLCGCFTYDGTQYVQTGTIPVLKSKGELREYLYSNGFVCDGIHYVRYKRSSGSSRVGKCLFVNEIVAARMAKWDRCGLKVKDGDPIDLAGWEAYISLPMSSIIDTIEIKPENILVIDDYDSVFNDKVVAVEIKDGHLDASEKECKISNCIWDGESLMDSSMFGKYSNKGMLLLRNRFFKTCAFNTNIQKFFADNNITEVSQLNGFTLASDISQIKLITTPSSIKYLKFGTLKQWLDNLVSTFGIVKYEKETHFFDGRYVQCHYQLLNTLHLSRDEVAEVLKPSLDYIGAVRADPAVLRYHIGYAFKSEDEDNCANPYKTKNDIVFKMLSINDKFADTRIYQDFRDTIVRGFLRNLKRGHVLLNGNYSTLLGNGLEMLKGAIGQFNGKSEIGVGNIHTKRFEYGKRLLCSRSPHICASNILLANNVANDEVDRYFNMSTEIVYVNAIGENIQQKLNGCDYDSDTMLITDDKLLVAAAERHYKDFLVPTNMTTATKIKRKYTNLDKADLDIKTSVNNIGRIVNLSQYLGSLMWDRINHGSTVEEQKEIFIDACKLAVLSNVEI